LQDLAVLQPQFPALSLFSHSVFSSSVWTDFAACVCLKHEQSHEPQSVLLTRAFPELSSALYTTHSSLAGQVSASEARLTAQNEAVLRELAAIQREQQLLLRGGIVARLEFPQFPTESSSPPLDGPTELPAVFEGRHIPGSNDPKKPELGPEYILAPAETVLQVWKEWETGVGGSPAVKDLEACWGFKWRYTTQQRTIWCRRKLILDQILLRIKAGLAPEAAVDEVEALRGSRSLYGLYVELQRKKSS